MDHLTTPTQALIQLLVYGQWNPETGREVVAELRSRGPAAIADLTAALKNPSLPKVTRMVVASLLGERCGPEAESALSHAAGDSDGDVAGTAKTARSRCDEAKTKPGPGAAARG